MLKENLLLLIQFAVIILKGIIGEIHDKAEEEMKDEK